jgi:curved DNA-binding protein
MQIDLRREPRRRSKRLYTVTWKDDNELTHSAQVLGIDESHSGIGIRCPADIRKGTIVYIQAEEEDLAGYTAVRHSAHRGSSYVIGLELDEEAKKTRPPKSEDTGSYYEFLQISPKAQAETIQRVYRFLAARYHPDNPETGDPEVFLRLNQAYETLADPALRARYDESLRTTSPEPNEIFGSVDFLDGIEGEINRRLAVLSLLYKQCRSNVGSPQISLLELEKQMGFPREYLDFTIWYLRSKRLAKQGDNAALELTCEGVDFVEENFDKLPLLGKLLGAPSSYPDLQADGNKGPAQKAEIFQLASGDHTSLS